MCRLVYRLSTRLFFFAQKIFARAIIRAEHSRAKIFRANGSRYQEHNFHYHGSKKESKEESSKEEDYEEEDRKEDHEAPKDRKARVSEKRKTPFGEFLLFCESDKNRELPRFGASRFYSPYVYYGS